MFDISWQVTMCLVVWKRRANNANGSLTLYVPSCHVFIIAFSSKPHFRKEGNPSKTVVPSLDLCLYGKPHWRFGPRKPGKWNGLKWQGQSDWYPSIRVPFLWKRSCQNRSVWDGRCLSQAHWIHRLKPASKKHLNHWAGMGAVSWFILFRSNITII